MLVDQNALTDYLDTVADLRGSEEVWAATSHFFAESGFDRLIYIHVTPSSAMMNTNLPAAWTQHYRDSEYQEIDPFLTHCCATLGPIGTGSDYCSDYDYLSDAQRRLIHEAAEFGMRAGFSATVRLRGSGGLGGWNLGSTLDRGQVEAIRIEKEPLLRMVAMYAHERLREAPEPNLPSLSRRELECLTWLMKGDRTKDIAKRLNLSPAAIELYVRNARIKLGARTREHAIARAIANGLLHP